MNQRRLSRRAALATLGGASGALVLAACGSPAPQATTAAPPAGPTSAPAAAQPAATAPGKVTVRIHDRANNVVEGGAQYELFKPGGHLDKWRDDHPNVNVVVEPLPPATPEYGPKLLAMHMGGTIGDVAYGATGSGTFEYEVASGIAGPLDDLVNQEKFDLGQYLPSMLNALRVNDTSIGSGPLYGLPILAHSGPTVLYYNKTLLANAGVKPPDGDTMTFDDLLGLAQKVTTKTADGRIDVYGLSPTSDTLGRREFLQFVCVARAFGAELLSGDGKKAQFNSPEAKQAWQWLYDLQFTQNVTPAPSVGQAAQVFLSGKLAMMVSQSNTGYTFSQKKDLDWDATAIPKGPSGQRGSMFEGDAYTVPALAKQKALGWELVKWMTNKDAGVLMCGIGLCGARQDVYDDATVKALKLQPLFNRLVTEALPFSGPANLRQVEISDVSGQAMSALWSGSAKPDDQFVNDLNTKIQQVLDKPRD